MPVSRTKAKLTDQEVASLVRQAFDGPAPRAVRELTEGYFNAAYWLQLEDGQNLVLKVAPPADVPVLTYEQDLMRGEVAAMRLASGDPRVPVPAVRFADLTRTRLPVDYLFMDALEGSTWTSVRDELSDAQNAEVERQLGATTAALNSIEHASFGYLATGPSFDSWFEAFGWMCLTLYADAARFGVQVPVSEDELRRLLDRHRGAFDAVTRPRLVHWDLWAGNVLVRLDDDRPIVTGVIDFERAMWADPLMEFIPGRLRDIEAYESGYGRPLLSTRAERLRRLFYNAYLGLVLVVEDGPRQYQDKSTVDWGRGLLERAATMLDEGDVIEDLLRYA